MNKVFSMKDTKVDGKGKKTTITIQTEDPAVIRNLLDNPGVGSKAKTGNTSKAKASTKKTSSDKKKDSIKTEVREVKPKTKKTASKKAAKPKALPAPSNKKKELTGKMLVLYKKIENVAQEQKKLNYKVWLNTREVFDKYDFWKSVEKIPHSSPTGTEIHYYKFNDAMLAKLNKRKEFKESFSKLNDNNKLLEGYYKKIRSVAGELKACFKTVSEYEAYCNKNIDSEVSKIRKYS